MDAGPCPDCAAGRLVLRYYKGWFFGCSENAVTHCRGWMRAHQTTHEPIGDRADTKTREARTAAHRAFDPLWKRGLMPRDAAYRWLMAELGLSYSECHFSKFNLDQCRAAARVARRKLEGLTRAQQGPQWESAS